MNTLFIRLRFILFLLVLLAFGRLSAQPAFPPTADGSCNNCVPGGYSKLDPSYQPAVSSPTDWGELQGKWTNSTEQPITLPDPPSEYSHNLGYITHHFVSLFSQNNVQGNIQEAISTTASGFKVGQEYSLVYAVLSSRLKPTTFGKSAKVTISTPGQPSVLVGEQETVFGLQPTPYNTWITRTFTFTATASTLVFKLSAGQMDPNKLGFVNFDIDNFPFPCASTVTGEVPLSQTDVNIFCPNTSFDLNTLVNLPPAGIENKWFTSSGHATGTEVANPGQAAAGTYYVFQYNPVYECYNRQLNQTSVKVADNPQVQLNASVATNACPETNVSLGTYVVYPLPAGHVVRWFNNANHSGAALDPLIAGSQSGTYYPFLFNTSSQCYSTITATNSLSVIINTPCCKAGNEQVKLTSNSFVLSCGQTANLNNFIAGNNNFQPGTSVEWFTTSYHDVNTQVADPTAVVTGTYYAFVHDPAANCYNVTTSTAKVIVSGINGTQVQLDTDTLVNACPSQTVNLHSAYSGNTPPGYQVVFYSTPNHANGTLVSANVSTMGTYYAFLFNTNTGCFNTDNSTATVEVVIVDCSICPATGTKQVTLTDNALENNCPKSFTVNLNSVIGGIVPGGLEVVWFDNAYRFGSKIANPFAVGVSGTYYAFLHDINGDCYNTGWSTSYVVVTITSPCPKICNAGSAQVALTQGGISNTCPSDLVDINTVLVSGPPANTVYQWFTDPNHNPGNLVADPNHVSTGTYYAFIYDATNNCYNTDNSTSKVSVIINECKVFTDLTIRLQGAMDGNSGIMHTNLHQSGLLPLTDPYGLGVTRPNNAFPLLVDWVKVEIRSAADPSIVLGEAVGLLKPDGNIQGIGGAAYPSFAPQFEPIQIVVKHRNHLPIMSNVINSFTTGNIFYNFTDALGQAYNDGSAPPQMISVTGAWCMPAGDLNATNTITSDDRDLMLDAFHGGVMDQYVKEDLNMDGSVDDVDVSYFNTNFYQALYSIITKY
nr:hypothetical protein [uncultured Dyadobacter sp.]